MDGKSKKTDSNYSSMKSLRAEGEQGSSSNFSLTSGSYMQSKNSTSGCSTGTDISRQKVKKKEAIKRCIRELKMLMPPGGNRKPGTVDTLQSVLHHMKRIKDKAPPRPLLDAEIVGGPLKDSIPLPEFRFPFSEGQPESWFRMILSPKEYTVLQVQFELLDSLGYPKNYWFNQSLLDYLYKRDVVTVLSRLASCQGKSLGNKQADSPAAKCQELMFAPSVNMECSSGGTGDEGKEETEAQEHMFFRVRHFKSIRQGFTLNRTESYTVFYGHVRMQKVHLDFPPGTPVEGLLADNNYLVIDCHPVKSAYLGLEHGVLPQQRCFSTRHSVYCHFSFLHPSAIPLLGYLPQDVVGTSIFDFYHPQDLHMLLCIYQLVLEHPNKNLKSAPYRLRTKNGDYIYVETEWTGFANPWTQRLDFVMGKHTVVQCPDSPNVFLEPTGKSRSNLVNTESKALQNKIKTMLFEWVDPQQSSVVPGPTASTSNLLTTPKEATKTKMVSFDKPAEKVTPEVESIEESAATTLNLSQKETALVYERLNYAQNILRFLSSCDVREGEEQEAKDDLDLSCSDGEGLAVDVELPIPKPPSFASSTKALVSEQEAREEMLASPGHQEESMEGISSQAMVLQPPTLVAVTALVAGGSNEDTYQAVSLTEDVLRTHELFQEKFYLQKMVREKEGLLTPRGRFRGLLRDRKRQKKRRRIATLDEDATMHKEKHIRCETVVRKSPEPAKFTTQVFRSSMLPMSPITCLASTLSTAPPVKSLPKLSAAYETDLTNIPKTALISSSSSSMRLPLAVTSTPEKDASLPVASTSTALLSVPMETEAMGAWPYYHTSEAGRGMNYMLPNLINPMLAQPLTRQSIIDRGFVPPAAVPQLRPTHAVVAPMVSREVLRNKSPSKFPCTPSVESISMDDTSSSLLYLLESNSDSKNNSSTSEEDQESIKKKSMKKVLPNKPCWLSSCDLDQVTANRYVLRPRLQAKVLRQDRLALKHMASGFEVAMQLDELMTEIYDNQDGEIVEDPEADLMFIMNDEALGNSDVKEMSENPDDTKNKTPDSPPVFMEDLIPESALHSTPTSCIDLTDCVSVHTLSPSSGEQSITREGMSLTPVSEVDTSSDKEIEKERVLPEKTTDSDSSESGSKASSDITPSDQRSNEEVQSSLKESDIASLDSTGNKSSNSDIKDEVAQLTKLLKKLFVPLEVDFDHSIKDDPWWLEQANFSTNVQQRLQLQNRCLQAVLKEDAGKLCSIQQPNLVVKQLNELLSLDVASTMDAEDEKPEEPVNLEEADNQTGRAVLMPSTSTSQDESVRRSGECVNLAKSRRITEPDSRQITATDSRQITEIDSRQITATDLRQITEIDSRQITEIDSRQITAKDSRQTTSGESDSAYNSRQTTSGESDSAYYSRQTTSGESDSAYNSRQTTSGESDSAYNSRQTTSGDSDNAYNSRQTTSGDSDSMTAGVCWQTRQGRAGPSQPGVSEDTGNDNDNAGVISRPVQNEMNVKSEDMASRPDSKDVERVAGTSEYASSKTTWKNKETVDNAGDVDFVKCGAKSCSGNEEAKPGSTPTSQENDLEADKPNILDLGYDTIYCSSTEESESNISTEDIERQMKTEVVGLMGHLFVTHDDNAIW